MGKVFNRHFATEDIQMANMHMKRCSISFVTGEMQLNVTVRNHYALIRMMLEWFVRI